MSQLKFSLKIFEICSLLYVSVLTVNVAFWQLFCFVIRSKCREGANGLGGTPTPCLLLPAPIYGLPSVVTLTQQCFKTSLEIYVAANKPCKGF